MLKEEAHRRIVSYELGCDVHINDDSSGESLYDLRVGSKHNPEIAIECVGAVDEQTAKLFGSSKKWECPPIINGDWVVEVVPGGPLKRLYRELAPLLSELEELAVWSAAHDVFLQHSNKYLWEKLDVLHINFVRCSRKNGFGRVHIIPPPVGGTVNDTADGVVEWLNEFVAAAARSDVVYKLNKSQAPQKEIFVSVSFGGVPWSVYSYLTGDLDILPAENPELPPSVTGVWIVLGPKKGIRWNNGWKFLG